MSINDFLKSKNINLIWEVIQEDELIKTCTIEQSNQIKLFIQSTLNNFFENEKDNISLKEINKKYIIFIINNIHQNLLNKKSNIIDISSCPKPELVTFEDIKKDRIDFIESALINKNNKHIILDLDIRLLKLILKGPKYAHWNNAEIGSHISYFRSPDIHLRNVHQSICYFHC
jgi:hypothetical protein